MPSSERVCHAVTSAGLTASGCLATGSQLAVHTDASVLAGRAIVYVPSGAIPGDPPKWGSRTPLPGPAPGRPRRPGARPGRPGPGRPPGAPRGRPGGAPGGSREPPPGTPIFGPFGPNIYYFAVDMGFLGGPWPPPQNPPRDPPGAPPPGGAKKCTFFWVFNNSPSRDSLGHFFRPPRDPPFWPSPGGIPVSPRRTGQSLCH